MGGARWWKWLGPPVLALALALGLVVVLVLVGCVPDSTGDASPTAPTPTVVSTTTPLLEEPQQLPRCEWGDLGVEFDGSHDDETGEDQPWGDLVVRHVGAAPCEVDLAGAVLVASRDDLVEQELVLDPFRMTFDPGHAANVVLSWSEGPCGEASSPSGRWRLFVDGEVRGEGVLACVPSVPIRLERVRWYGLPSSADATCSFRDTLNVIGDDTPDMALARYLGSASEEWFVGFEPEDFVERVVAPDAVWFGLVDESDGVARLLVDHRGDIGWSVHQATFCPRS